MTSAGAAREGGVPGLRAGAAQLAALARVLTATAARRVAPVLAPLYFGLFVIGSVLFAPNALRAVDVTSAAIASPVIALGLLGAWLLVTMPAARAAIELPSTFLLRALPVPRWQFLLVSGAHLIAIELPWIALWARGEGLAAAAAAGATAAGAHGLLLARSARSAEIAAAALLLAWSARPGVAPPLAAAASAAAASIGVAAAWRRAPERATRRRSLRLPASAPAALAATHLLAIRRTDAAALGRGLLLAALGGLAAPLAARGHDLDAPASVSALSLGIAAGTLSIACSGIAGAALRAERAQAWLLDATGAGGALRVIAASGATAAGGAALGLIHGAMASAGLGAGLSSAGLAARLAGLGAALGAALGVLAAWQARLAATDGPRRGGRDLARRAGGVGLSIAGLAALGEPAVGLVAATALALAASSSRRAAALPEPRGAHAHAGARGQRPARPASPPPGPEDGAR